MSMLIVRERGHENETRPCCDSLCHQSVGLYSLVHLQLLSYVCARRRCGGSFEWEAGRAGVLVHVADDGVGIPEQMKSRLFSPFATTKQDSGSGLGLWVSRSILEKHDGTIRVSSADAGYSGTTVSIFLPLKATSRISADDAAAAVMATGS